MGTRKIRSVFITMFLTLLCLLSLHFGMASTAQVKSVEFSDINGNKGLLFQHTLTQVDEKTPESCACFQPPSVERHKVVKI